MLLDRVGRPVLRLVPGALKLAADALRLGLDQGPLALIQLLTRPLRDAARWVARMWKLELLIGIPIALLAAIPYQLHISAPFEVISAGPVTVRSQASGVVARFLVRTDDRVKAGDVVALLVDDELRLRRRVAEAELDEGRARLAELEAGYRGEEVARARIALQMREQATALAAAELDRARALHDQALTSRRGLDAAVAGHQTALAREGQARAELGRLVAGHRPEERARQRARVRRAEQELASVDQELAWTKVRAAVDGRVVTPPYALEQRIGAHVARGDGLVEVIAPARLAARLVVPERFASDVAPAMPVTLRFFKDPDVAYEARLDAIEPAVTPRASQLAGSLGMLTSLAHLGEALPLGTAGIAKIDAGSQSILGLLLRRADRAAWVTFWSWW